MRIAIISDIHANFEGLSALSDLLTTTDRIICLGDLIGYYCQVNEVLDYVRQHNVLCISGNHDHFLLNGCPPDVPPAVQFGIDYADRVIDPDHRRWLASLPLIWAGISDLCSLFCAHGSPWHPLDDYLYADSPLLPRLNDFGFDLMAFGQTHHVLQKVDSKPFWLNPGSVGQPRDMVGYASASLIETRPLTIEIARRPFDVNKIIGLAVQHGAQDWIRKYLT
jgi:predicted phosphodiesterase